jgi:hypothetical protein
VQSTPTGQRIVIDAVLEESVVRGTLTEPSGGRREFHGWLELTAAIEATLLAATGSEDER